MISRKRVGNCKRRVALMISSDKAMATIELRGLNGRKTDEVIFVARELVQNGDVFEGCCAIHNTLGVPKLHNLKFRLGENGDFSAEIASLTGLEMGYTDTLRRWGIGEKGEDVLQTPTVFYYVPQVFEGTLKETSPGVWVGTVHRYSPKEPNAIKKLRIGKGEGLMANVQVTFK